MKNWAVKNPLLNRTAFLLTQCLHTHRIISDYCVELLLRSDLKNIGWLKPVRKNNHLCPSPIHWFHILVH